MVVRIQLRFSILAQRMALVRGSKNAGAFAISATTHRRLKVGPEAGCYPFANRTGLALLSSGQHRSGLAHRQYVRALHRSSRRSIQRLARSQHYSYTVVQAAQWLVIPSNFRILLGQSDVAGEDHAAV